jgi:hypothetical protein
MLSAVPQIRERNLMLKRGLYSRGDGNTYNIIGISKGTEDGKCVVILQVFNWKHKGRLSHVPHSEWQREYVPNLKKVKALSVPIIHGTPPVIPGTLPPGKYLHFKGGEYNCIGVSIPMDNAGELVVIYQALYGKHIYEIAHRPLTMFREQVVKPDYAGPRFSLIEEYKTPIIAKRNKK